MIIMYEQGNSYLVKTKAFEDRVFYVDLNLNTVMGYDYVEKFLKFGCFKPYIANKNTKQLVKKIKKILGIINI